MADRRVVVTGCGGFVGRYLTALLAEEGFDVWGVDVKPDVPDLPLSEYRSIDLQSKADVEKLLKDAQAGSIIHLAAQSSGGISFRKPHETIVNNSLSVLHILEVMRTSEAKVRLLAIGSADVYGSVEPVDLPLVETMPTRPNNPYALSKAIQEECCALYASVYGVDVVSTRSFNHTGAGRPDTFVLSSFARQVVEIKKGKRKPVVNVGNIDVKRDFSDVRDVSRAYVLLLDGGESGQIYNVCSGTSRSLREILERLAELAGIELRIEVDKERLRAADIRELRGDASRLIAATGWQQSIPFDDTLQSLLDEWDARLS
ncbi:MAG: GDP-mannose 4,6-dehydratase [bacterium]|nr:GDP-mannose 4,6-dehydratase [bacterium]